MCPPIFPRFADPKSWLVCKKGCRGGDGGPPFCVRECREQHEVDICFDCPEFPCEKTTAYKGIREKAKEYRELGKAEWVRSQLKKANQGYEAHTGKFYRVCRSDSPPVS